MAEETDENTEETDENSDHNVGMLEGEANGVSDLVSHQDRIGTNGTIVDASRLESILFPPRTPIFPNGSMRTSNIHTIDLCVHRLLEFHCMIRLQLRTAQKVVCWYLSSVTLTFVGRRHTGYGLAEDAYAGRDNVR